VTVGPGEAVVQGSGHLEHARPVGLELLLRTLQDFLGLQGRLERVPQLFRPQVRAEPPVSERSRQEVVLEPELELLQRRDDLAGFRLEMPADLRGLREQRGSDRLEEADASAAGVDRQIGHDARRVLEVRLRRPQEDGIASMR